MITYQNFAELAGHHREGEAYRIRSRFTGSALTIMAPHGGGIEPGSCAIAGAIAGNEHNCYLFQGILPSDNRRLHLTSCLFDEPQALALAARSAVIVSVHGCAGHEPMVFVGGGSLYLANALREALTSAGFAALPALAAGLRGRHPANLCNRGTSGQGVQLELSLAMREHLLGRPDAEWQYQPLQPFLRFTETVRQLLGSKLGAPQHEADSLTADD